MPTHGCDSHVSKRQNLLGLTLAIALAATGIISGQQEDAITPLVLIQGTQGNLQWCVV